MKKTTTALLKQTNLTESTPANKDLDFLKMSLERKIISHNYQISLIKKFGAFIAKLWSAYIEANKTFVKAHYVNDGKLYLNK